MSIYVFVYGTLRSGEINDLAQAAAARGLPAPRLAGTARVPGRLVDFGDWPGLLPTQDGSTVQGEIYEVDPALVELMDEIEEYTPGRPCCFVRRDVVAQGTAGAVACQYYPIDPAFRAQARDIGADDWVSYRRSRDAGRLS
ncbi:gamma-glutamylcyclotransferase family protein [Bordetella sp. 2513F-2]